MRIATWTVLLVLFSALPRSDALGAPDAAEIDALCQAHVSKLKPLLVGREFASAVLELARYEGALVDRYPSAALEKGTFRSAAHQLEFRAPGWLATTASPPRWTRALRYEPIVTLEREGAILLVVEVHRDPAMSDPGNAPSDASIKETATALASHYGKLDRTMWRIFGTNRVLVAELAVSGPRKSTVMFLNRGERLILFALKASATARARFRELPDLVKSVRLDHASPVASTVDKLRERHRGETADDVLALARSLAKAGEFHAAGEDLARLRARLAESIAAPTVHGSVGKFSGYGINLTNPDRAGAKMDARTDGAFPVLRYSPKRSPAVIFVAVIDLAVLHGPRVLSLLPPSARDERRRVIGGTTLGAFEDMGGKNAERQRFRKIGGRTAYEVTTGPTGRPCLKVVGILRGHVAILVFGAAASANFELDWMVENLIDKDLEF
jgi:hypothetical protein